MPGTREGGIKAAKTNKERYGEDFYKIRGAIGGRKSRGGGFAYMIQHDPERVREVGRKGGLVSRRSGR